MSPLAHSPCLPPLQPDPPLALLAVRRAQTYGIKANQKSDVLIQLVLPFVSGKADSGMLIMEGEDDDDGLAPAPAAPSCVLLLPERRPSTLLAWSVLTYEGAHIRRSSFCAPPSIRNRHPASRRRRRRLRRLRPIRARLRPPPQPPRRRRPSAAAHGARPRPSPRSRPKPRSTRTRSSWSRRPSGPSPRVSPFVLCRPRAAHPPDDCAPPPPSTPPPCVASAGSSRAAQRSQAASQAPVAPSRPLSPVLAPAQPGSRPASRPNGATAAPVAPLAAAPGPAPVQAPAPTVATTPAATAGSTSADLLARLPELIALLPTLSQLPALLPTLATVSSRLDTAAAGAVQRHAALQDSLTTTSASLDNLWAEVSAVDGRLTAVESTLDNLQGSVNNLWTELGSLDQEKAGFVRLDDVQWTVKQMEKAWDDKLAKLRAQLASPAGLRSPTPRSDPTASSSVPKPSVGASSGGSSSSNAARYPSSSLGKHARSDSASSSSMPPPSALAGPSSAAYPAGLGHANGPATKRPRIVSEMAVESLLDSDDEIFDEPEPSAVRPVAQAIGTASPARRHPPSTPPPRASPSLVRPDPTFTPSTSSSATKAAAKANPTPHHHAPQLAPAPFPLFATSPRPPKDTPTSPTYESPRRVGQASGAPGPGSLTPGRALYFTSDTPRSRAARGGGATGTTPAQRRLASDSHSAAGGPSAAAAASSPPQPAAGARTLSYDVGALGLASQPAGLRLLPSLPLTSSDSSAPSSANTPTDSQPPAALPSAHAAAALTPGISASSANPFPFLIHPTPPPVRPQPRGVPPTPPAPRTMFGTERDRDDRFGDDEA